MCLDGFPGQDQINWAFGEAVIFREPVKEQLMDILRSHVNGSQMWLYL